MHIMLIQIKTYTSQLWPLNILWKPLCFPNAWPTIFNTSVHSKERLDSISLDSKDKYSFSGTSSNDFLRVGLWLFGVSLFRLRVGASHKQIPFWSIYETSNHKKNIVYNICTSWKKIRNKGIHYSNHPIPSMLPQ